MLIQPLTTTSRAFRDRNLITSGVVEVYSGTYNGKTVHVELSKESPPYWSQMVERDPNGGPLYGITIRRPDGTTLDPDPSCCQRSMKDALDYIKSL